MASKKIPNSNVLVRFESQMEKYIAFCILIYSYTKRDRIYFYKEGNVKVRAKLIFQSASK